MCGIAGIYSPKGIIEYGVLRSMSENLKHRGPDGYGYLLYSKSTGNPRVWHNLEVSKKEILLDLLTDVSP